MKTCPICQSIAFDDALTCYGCLYDFSKDVAGEANHIEQRHDEAVDTANVMASSISFMVTLTPEGRDLDNLLWRCEVGPVSA